jgi:AbrB family looped-hinge helix DNA binding protein
MKVIPDRGMTEVQVTSKGQITIPVELRRKHNIEEGGRVQVVEEEGKIVVRRAMSFYDLAGVDAGIATVDEVKQTLDRMREEDDEG